MHWDGERPAYPLSSQRPPSIFLSVDISFKEDIPTIEGGPLGLPEGAVLYTWNGLRIRIRSTKVFVFNAGWVGMLFNRSEETAGSLDSANQQRKSTARSWNHKVTANTQRSSRRQSTLSGGGYSSCLLWHLLLSPSWQFACRCSMCVCHFL